MIKLDSILEDSRQYGLGISSHTCYHRPYLCLVGRIFVQVVVKYAYCMYRCARYHLFRCIV
ncbi:hypothetical protein APHNP_1022 [Anaplasma phagocytophilum str. ApNP]|uniref:Uncharacterized protein n=1 Tax=Anaplasma phagocytophilum str. ApNP TaxID=1359153 RepID=A0A0F3NKE7_ANAPH|nr:hypothetical protein APHNP_1022 [Anaplasma phagocytophilum str. ApNP]